MDTLLHKKRNRILRQSIIQNMDVLKRIQDGEILIRHIPYWHLRSVQNRTTPLYHLSIFPSGPTIIHDVLGLLLSFIDLIPPSNIIINTKAFRLEYQGNLHPIQWAAYPNSDMLLEYKFSIMNDGSEVYLDRENGWKLVKDVYGLSYDEMLKLNALDCATMASREKCGKLLSILSSYFENFSTTLYSLSLKELTDDCK